LGHNDITVGEWREVYDLVERAAEVMLGEVVVSRHMDRIGVHAMGTDDKALELSLPDLVDMVRQNRIDDLVKYVQVTCAIMDGCPTPRDGMVLTMRDGLVYVWRNGAWHRMFE
jgi:hypothetical protein